MNDLWTFNGIDAGTGRYLRELRPSALLEAARAERPGADLIADLERRRGTRFGVKDGVDVRVLGEAGWAVILAAPADADEQAAQAAVLAALRPLLAHRRAQARSHADRYREYTGADGYRVGETAATFLARHGAAPGPVDPDRVPYYLLLVGDPRAVPFSVQRQLAVHHAVGRLWFPTAEAYAHYARSVLDAETRGLRLPRRLTVFGTSHANDEVTRASATHLLAPLADGLADDPQLRGWTIDRVLGKSATRQALADLLHTDAPALLFAACHGVGFRKDDPLQQRHQGALLGQDWPGPQKWRKPIPERFYLAGEHLAADADLLGSLVFLYASHGAGTPAFDDKARPDPGERVADASQPFIAGLPTALLGRPRGGALAVIGQVDHAWGHAALWPGSGDDTPRGQVAAFERSLAGLMSGLPVGAAMATFARRHAELAADIAARLRGPADPALAVLWSARNDAGGHVILGDPAVRAMVGEGPPTGRERPAAPPPIDVTTPPEPDPPAPPGDPLGDLAARLARTVAAVLADLRPVEIRTYAARDMTNFFDTEGRVIDAELRAFTRIAGDGDTIVIVPGHTGAADQPLLVVHQAIVQQAHEARAELLRTILLTATRLAPRPP